MSKLDELFDEIVEKKMSECVDAFNKECLKMMYFVPLIDVLEDGVFSHNSGIYMSIEGEERPKMFICSSLEDCEAMEQELGIKVKYAVVMNFRHLVQYARKINKDIIVNSKTKMYHMDIKDIEKFPNEFIPSICSVEIFMNRAVGRKEEKIIKKHIELEPDSLSDCFGIIEIGGSV